MTAGRTRRYEELLLVERERTLKALHHIEAEEAEPQVISAGDSRPEPSKMADTASDTQEQEADFLSATRLSDHLAEVDDALRLLREEPKKFGHCQVCGARVDSHRLEIVPWSTLCVTCARKREEA